MLIYIVDDQDYIREILKINLEKNGFIVKEFESPVELINSIENNKIPQIIISDIVMPKMSGIELCKKIKNNPLYQNIYFILLTAKIQVNEKIQGLESGADDYIVKPFKIKEVLARVNVGKRIFDYNQNILKKSEQIKKMYDELKTAQNKIVNIEKLNAIGKIASIVSHELKNPLANIKTNLWLLENNESDNSTNIISDIKLQADYCLEIINNVLQFYKLQEPLKSNFNLLELLNETLIYLKLPEIINLDIKIEENLVINADKFQIKMVFLNLIKNAIEKLIPLKIKNKLIKIFSKKDNETIYIYFVDNGGALDKNKYNKIFETFYTTKSKGTGLGLSFSKQIIENHKGKFYVQSDDKNKTTSFVIEFKI